MTIDDNLLTRASQLTGIVEQTTLFKEGLKVLIALGGTQKSFESAPRKERSIVPDIGRERLADDTEPKLDSFQVIMEISRRCAALPNQDSRSEDEILGYNDIGTFS